MATLMERVELGTRESIYQPEQAGLEFPTVPKFKSHEGHEGGPNKRTNNHEVLHRSPVRLIARSYCNLFASCS